MGRVCRTTVALSVAGAKGTWLARVGVSARVVGCPEELPRSRRGSGGGGRGWDSTRLPGRVCTVVVTAEAVVTIVTVYPALVLVVPSRLV